jgi:ATP-dependent DNA ligase
MCPAVDVTPVAVEERMPDRLDRIAVALSDGPDAVLEWKSRALLLERLPANEKELPSGLVLDGELIALKGDHPWFPSVCDRILHGRDIPVVYVVFDLLHDSEGSLLKRRYSERRQRLEALNLNNAAWQTFSTFDDGENALHRSR